MEIGSKAPSLEFEATKHGKTYFSAFKGSFLVVYFYPKDNTPGCTTQGQEFAELFEQFRVANADILGVSRDSMKSHERFSEKFNFPFGLISDPDESVCNAFGVIQEKNMYGRKVMGIVRSTFVFDPDGNLVKSYLKVKAKGHAQMVLDDLKQGF